MQDATVFFQRILRQYGVHDADRYVLTAIRTADRDGYTLYAVIHRPRDLIEVPDKYSGYGMRSYGRRDRGFYQPFRHDDQGRSLDTVIDWAGVPRTDIRTQKGQAILMTLAANSVLNGKQASEYWAAEKRWISGEYLKIVAERHEYLQQRLGLATAYRAPDRSENTSGQGSNEAERMSWERSTSPRPQRAAQRLRGRTERRSAYQLPGQPYR